MALTQVPIELSSTPGIVDNSNATAITIDSSENVLVGKTSLAIANEGIVFEKGGAAEFTTDAARVMRLNRTSGDGSIVEFNKDGTTVGSILSSGGDGIIVQGVAAGSGLLFHNSDALLPAQNGNAVDATIDLGRSTPSAFRFKDLYLSGLASMTGLEPGIVTIGSGSYFIGNSANGYRFNNAADTSNLMILKDNGSLLVGRTAAGATGNGHSIRGGDSAIFSRDSSGESMIVARNASAGDLVRFYCNGSDRGSIDFDGTNTISYTSSSDQRLKDNIADADDAGSKVDAIQVRKFDWIADGSHQDYGMIAQELQAVAPEAVSGDPDSDEMMGVDYSKLVPMLVKEIQSLRARVAQLENS